MTNQLGRRALAGATAFLPAAALIGSAHAQGAPESTFEQASIPFEVVVTGNYSLKINVN